MPPEDGIMFDFMSPWKGEPDMLLLVGDKKEAEILRTAVRFLLV
jgi:hypothetical protein